MATSGAPWGCGSSVNSLYYKLCDLGAVWGVVLESIAGAGIVSSFILLVVLLASLPFITNNTKKSSVGPQAFFLIGTFGLFCLTFAFIVGKNFATCASRRFLFGVLFAGCFACLLTQCVKLNMQACRGDQGPRGRVLCLGALGLWLVEVIINTEWLIITVVRYPLPPVNVTVATLGAAGDITCNIANQDFAMALIYVLSLLLAVLVASLPTLCGKHKQLRQEGAFILATAFFSVLIWVAWITMYVFGNQNTGGPSWDDPTLAIALVGNGWVFLILYTIPEICSLTREAEEGMLGSGNDLYPNGGGGYETILGATRPAHMLMENKAFSMDEPNSDPKTVSPYSGYNGHLNSSVYQPTELSVISKGRGNPEVNFKPQIPRATTHLQSHSKDSTMSVYANQAADTNTQHRGNGLQSEW
ncbi:G-protein coupled receptor family C group 5 member C [Esox lucius]|uniref:G-protein coupled receptors family 3 profile domain-containing protein n=1 Tax=Esox lucius TaxID=8010 RepID=A0A3P8Y0T1_ESOLU|nr:G-protein coupled receptor family C group 5 member C [Esox lucius]